LDLENLLQLEKVVFTLTNNILTALNQLSSYKLSNANWSKRLIVV